MALARPLRAIAWELRAAWASGRRVSVSLERADLDRLEGHVDRVAATDATVTVAGRIVPLDRVLAVHLPSRLGDSTFDGGRWSRQARKLTTDGQDELPGFRA
jgi:hypothetical protein